ncbi:TPA: LysR family transcriptional regulator [Aeromonas salmonicida]|nr:LysR family transcriptional regulator [Aeromonas salmonicida]
MELLHLRCFLAVARELHFARAAERPHIKQSLLSHTIKELEEDLGEQLFVRTSRSTRLTRADALKGKQLGIAVSTWPKPEGHRKDGCYGRTMNELTSPFEVTALRAGIRYLPGFFLNGVGDIDDRQLAANALAYRAYVRQGERAFP